MTDILIPKKIGCIEVKKPLGIYNGAPVSTISFNSEPLHNLQRLLSLAVIKLH